MSWKKTVKTKAGYIFMQPALMLIKIIKMFYATSPPSGSGPMT